MKTLMKIKEGTIIERSDDPDFAYLWKDGYNDLGNAYYFNEETWEK